MRNKKSSYLFHLFEMWKQRREKLHRETPRHGLSLSGRKLKIDNFLRKSRSYQKMAGHQKTEFEHLLDHVFIHYDTPEKMETIYRILQESGIPSINVIPTMPFIITDKLSSFPGIIGNMMKSEKI